MPRLRAAVPRGPQRVRFGEGRAATAAFGAWCEPWAAECLRVLKPGGHLLAFGGTRTWHRLACAVEDAGFEVRDSIAWLYGCLSDDTEILTSEGWVRYDRAKEGQHALAFDTATGALAWQAIQHVHRYPYAGEMVRLHSEHTDQLLTPNHRVILDAESRLPYASDVCDLRDAMVEAERMGQADRGALLLSAVQRSAARPGVGEARAQGSGGVDRRQPGVLPGEDDRAEQPRMEGRRYRVQEARELRRSAVRASAGMGATDGPQGRVHHGAPATDGRPLRVPADQAGSHQPREPRPQGQPTGEPDPLAVEPGAQALRVGEDGGGRLLPSTGVTADVVDYAGVVWCITVPHGAFIARRNGLIFATGNSGFPKSLDVSKAIDKRANVNDETHRRIALVAEVIRTHREAKGMERSAVSLAVVGTPSGACWNWEHQQLPSAEMWPAIKRVLDIPDKFDGLIEGTRAQFIGAEREVIGERTTGLGTGRGAVAYIGDSDNRDVTAPATDAAREWQGWGTALKPAFEPVVVARKPLAGTVAANVLEHGTGALNIDGCRVGDGGQLSWAEPRGIGYMGGGSNAGAVAATENAKGRWPANVVLDETQAEALDEQSGESRDGTAVKRNRSEDGRAPYEASSYMITDRSREDQTYGGQGGASRFFFIAREDNPCHSTSSASTVESPSSHPRGPADSAPSDAATTACPDGERLTGSPSTSETPSASRPSVESGTTPTTSTAGASSPDWQPGEPSQMVSRARYAASLSRTATTTTTTSPSSSAGSVDPTTSSTTQASAPGVPLDELGSRFNYVAKADASERPRVNGTAHPTVKPLDLMRWLVRLVTPPGGTVLEPFAGSGTTVEACIVEGFQCIAIEREADYLPLIRQRIDRRRDPVEALRGQAADLGLFDLLGGEGA